MLSKSVDLWHKQYTSTLPTSHHSTISLTLNTIETSLRLHLGENVSTSLIDNILLSPLHRCTSTHSDIGTSVILSNIKRYKSSFECVDCIQNNTQKLDHVITTLNKYVSQTKKAITCILRDTNKLTIILLYKYYKSSDYILYEPTERLQYKLNSPHFLFFQSDELLLTYLKNIFCIANISNEYIAEYIRHKSNNSIGKDIDYYLLCKDLKVIGVELKLQNENIAKTESKEQMDENWLFNKLKHTQFKDMGGDENLVLDREEYHAYFAFYGMDERFTCIYDSIFDTIDANNDGTVSLIEWFKWQNKFKKNDLHKLFMTTFSPLQIQNEVNQSNEEKTMKKNKSKTDTKKYIVTDAIQDIYDKYLKQYGYSPKLPAHLMSFSKEIGSIISFMDCRNIIMVNKETIVNEKQIEKDKPYKINRRPMDDNSGFFERPQLNKIDNIEKDYKIIETDRSKWFQSQHVKTQCKDTEQNETENDFKTCFSLNRIANIMVTAKENVNYAFDTFLCKESNESKDDNHTYSLTTLMDDYHHLMEQHDAALEDITSFLSSEYGLDCFGTNCEYLSRNYQNTENMNKEKELKLYHSSDKKLIMFSKQLNKIHAYLLHSFDLNYTLSKAERLQMFPTQKKEEEKDDMKQDIEQENDIQNIEMIEKMQRVIEEMQRVIEEKKNKNAVSLLLDSEADPTLIISNGQQLLVSPFDSERTLIGRNLPQNYIQHKNPSHNNVAQSPSIELTNQCDNKTHSQKNHTGSLSNDSELKTLQQIWNDDIENIDNNESAAQVSLSKLSKTVDSIQTIKFKDIDFAIFDDERDNCASFGNYIQNDIIHRCCCVKRVISALKFYEYLDIRKSEDARSAFTVFVADNYKHYLDDIIHLTTVHEQHLESINNALLKEAYFKCDIDKCLLTARHCRLNETTKLDTDIDGHFLFYQDTFDTVHYYLLHLFEMGLRIQKTDDILDETDAKGAHFLTKKLLNSSKRKKLAEFFARFSTKDEPSKLPKQTSKFKLQSVVDTEDDETFMDRLCEFLISLKFQNIANDDEIKMLRDYLQEEEFTTDSLMNDIYDIRMNRKSSNVLNIIQNQTIAKAIFLYIQEHKLRLSAFSTGFIFWYWPYYGKSESSNLENSKYKDYAYWNYNDFGGHTTYELYIKCGKYRNLKEEILRNEDNEIGTNAFQEMVVLKSQEYLETKRVKSIMAKGRDEGVTLHYDIPEFESLHASHLMSIILYCDFSQLCTNFSKTFRRIKANETLESIKNRNSNYWWMSKLLRETIQKYGINGVHKHKNRQSLSVLTRSSDEEYQTGPFYCGMDKVMVIPSFATRLCGPISTTTQQQVALNFADETGMSLQFNNKYVDGGKYLRFFDSSWISRYKEEDERIFMGGTHLLQVESILLTSTMLKFCKFFNALYWFNAVIDGGRLFGMNKGFTKKDLKIIQSLVDQQTSGIVDYILETFSVFTLSKKTIIINMDNIARQCPTFLRDFMFDKFAGGVGDKETIVYSDVKTNFNLLRPKLLNTFTAMTNIVIYCTDNDGHKSYRFSLNRLLTYLSMLSSLKREKIKCTLNGVWKKTPNRNNNYDEKRSWLFYTYSKMSSTQLQSDIFSSSLVDTIDPYFGNKQDTLTFECLNADQNY